MDAEGSGREYKCDLHVAEVDDRDYDNLFMDFNGREYNHVFDFRLARFVRAWYPTATDADNCSLEDMLERGGEGYNAIDFLFSLLCHARHEWVRENDGEPTLEQCCDELTSWSDSNCQYGARVIVWESGTREVRWGFGDEYAWADLDAVLKGVTLETGEEPDWWDDNLMTDYEYCDFHGQRFLKGDNLPADDPRSHGYEEEEEEED
ncbi:hypothetical protein QF001_005387 [Paraburkholderia youngii]|uniref:hypothetical protein n=1 Tax=Paraburkholderia youngii TaxID=2782701 RepID=UPI003D1D5347